MTNCEEIGGVLDWLVTRGARSDAAYPGRGAPHIISRERGHFDILERLSYSTSGLHEAPSLQESDLGGSKHSRLEKSIHYRNRSHIPASRLSALLKLSTLDCLRFRLGGCSTLLLGIIVPCFVGCEQQERGRLLYIT